MREQTYIYFTCLKCGANYCIEDNYSKEEREEIIYNHCSKSCESCEAEESVQWKILKE